uniref:Uncharacterized protein n=1 Tax=Anguilla anguilla TaxID=7936 RepID=A0A0E9SUJ0_ANGAN
MPDWTCNSTPPSRLKTAGASPSSWC